MAKELGEVKDQVARIAEFVQGTGTTLRQNAEQYRADGAEAGAYALIAVHDYLFRERRELGAAGQLEAWNVATRTLGMLEAELAALDYEVYVPEPGQPIDLKWMRIVGTEPELSQSGFAEVSRAVSCAYGKKLPDGGHKPVRLAEATVRQSHEDGMVPQAI